VFGVDDAPETVECSCCEGGVARRELRVEVAGVNNGECADCGVFNGDYFLDWTTDFDDIIDFCFPPGTSCGWVLQFPEVCGFSRAHVVIACGLTAVQVQFALMPTDCAGGAAFLRWAQSFDSSPLSFDCLFDALELPFVEEGSSAACSVTDDVRIFAS
jgi:hypothetical protein